MLVCPLCGEVFEKPYTRDTDGASLIPDHCEGVGSIVECPMSWCTVQGPLDEIIDTVQVVSENKKVVAIKAETDFDTVLRGLVERASLWNWS